MLINLSNRGRWHTMHVFSTLYLRLAGIMSQHICYGVASIIVVSKMHSNEAILFYL